MSEKTTKNGRKPLASKASEVPLREDDLFGNLLRLEPEMEKEIAAQGLEGRFVDAKKLYEANGYHAKGWVPYKRKALGEGSQDFKFGNDPDGVIRRGTLILAVKTKDNCERHRAFLKQKAERQSANLVGVQAANLRKFAKESNLDTRVDEGYDDADDK